MAFKICLDNMQDEKKSNKMKIGNDNGMVGGQNYERSFRVMLYDNKWLLTEYKNSRHFAEFSRTFEVIVDKLDEPEKTEAPAICDYIDEYEENCGKTWKH